LLKSAKRVKTKTFDHIHVLREKYVRQYITTDERITSSLCWIHYVFKS